MKFDTIEKRIEKMDDRQLLEFVLINQVSIYQLLQRFNAFSIEKFGDDFSNLIEHKDEAYLDLIRSASDFQLQYTQLKDDKEI